ncbi:MAG: NADH-quinone oxidoreductase subunit N [Thermodesulfobacteriota bacterium]
MELVFPRVDFLLLAPIITVSVTGFLVLIFDLLLSKEKKHLLAYIGLAGLGVVVISSVALWGENTASLNGMVLTDNFAIFFNLVFSVIAGLSLLLSVRYIREMGINYGEYYALIIFSTLGMMVMGMAGDLLMVFLGMELLSVPIYILAGFLKRDARSNEAALKYFLLGAFSAAFLLYGIALIYGAAGTTNIEGIARFASGPGALKNPFLLMGMGLIIIGLGFKVALVPFHMWTPDAYEGAPVAVTAFMSVAPKAAGFAVFLRVLLVALPSARADWLIIISVLAVLTMTLGNVAAIAQTNIKRMLAYSSIAHAGYILVALVAGDEMGGSAVLFYLLVYSLMNLGAFGIVILLVTGGEERSRLSDFAGLATSHPVAAAAMALFMLSLTGIPPTAGFVGKFYLFSAAVNAGFIWLAIIAVLNSAVSVYYYLRVIIIMYMSEASSVERPLILSPSSVIALVLAAAGTLALGLYPTFFLGLAQESIKALLG